MRPREINLLDYEGEHKTLLYLCYIGKQRRLTDELFCDVGSVHKFVTYGKKDSEGNYWGYYLSFQDEDTDFVRVKGTPPITINPDEWNVCFFKEFWEGQS
jgi:hypothetical protein